MFRSVRRGPNTARCRIRSSGPPASICRRGRMRWRDISRPNACTRDRCMKRQSVAAGLVLAVAYTASPLAVWVLVLGALLVVAARRGLPSSEQRLLAILLAAAVAVRLIFIALIFIKNIPYHHDQ